MQAIEARAIRLGALIEACGPDVSLQPGARLVRDVAFEGGAAQLVAELRDAGSFSAQLLRDGAPLWQGDLDLAEFASWDRLAARIARERKAAPTATPERTEATRAWGAKEEALTRGLLPPIVGEVWVMDVRVEDDDDNEVRYRSINIGGEEYGAPRVLARKYFEETFVASQNGYRMLVRVLEVGEESVVYQRISAQRELAGKPRACPMIVFLANFMPEAAAY
jgi:hypothetical protein